MREKKKKRNWEKHENGRRWTERGERKRKIVKQSNGNHRALRCFSVSLQLQKPHQLILYSLLLSLFFLKKVGSSDLRIKRRCRLLASLPFRISLVLHQVPDSIQEAGRKRRKKFEKKKKKQGHECRRNEYVYVYLCAR